MKKIRFLTAGESHGKGLMGIIEGIPAGLSLTAEDLRPQMLRRKMGHGRGARQQMETDAVEILSGVRHGKTLGSPLSFVIWNQDWENWRTIMQVESLAEDSPPVERQIKSPRPGHADWVGGLKYGHSDLRNVLERSSARETAMRVALGCVARKLLSELGVEIASRVVQIGTAQDRTELNLTVAELNARVDASPVRCLDAASERAMMAEVDAAGAAGDTLGGVFEVLASGAPLGLGSYTQWDRRLEGEIGSALMSLNAIKGVEMGIGFAAAGLRGSQVQDEYLPGEGESLGQRVSYETNRAGGVTGGMTTGQLLSVRAAMKPISTLRQPLRSVHLETGEATTAHFERSDICAVPSAAVIGESLVALVLANAVLDKFGGDSMEELVPRVREWNRGTRPAE